MHVNCLLVGDFILFGQTILILDDNTCVTYLIYLPNEVLQLLQAELNVMMDSLKMSLTSFLKLFL